LQTIMDAADPTILLVDIEGGELNIFDRIDLSKVRHVVMEVHKSVIGLEGVNKVLQVFSREGLYLDPDGTNGAVFLFSRSNFSDASVPMANKT
jgi:hypothetical protein